MYGIWLSLKRNLNCSANSTRIFLPEKSKGRNRTFPKATPPRDLLPERENPASTALFWQKQRRERFKDSPVWEIRKQPIRHRCSPNWQLERDLCNGDASRNIIEMIFHASSSTMANKRPKKINRVLKVTHSLETLKRFEAYRESVKKRARGERRLHPRSVVDGNELLLFCTTTMSCCPKRRSTEVSELCLGSSCKVCRIIRSGFEIMNTNMIALSTSCCDVAGRRHKAITGMKRENGKCAVVVCRAIAGRVVDVTDSTSEEGFDSVGSCGLDGKLDHLFLRDPRAILPCFVIICS